MSSDQDYNSCTNNSNAHMSQEMTMAPSPKARVTALNLLKSNIDADFDKLGTKKQTPPPSKNNLAAIAWEFFISHTLQVRASARYKAATKEAVKAGVLFDHEKEPLEAGTKKEIYNRDSIVVSVEVRSPYEKVDVDKMISYLVGKGVNEEVLNEGRKFASTMTRAPHIFKAVIE